MAKMKLSPAKGEMGTDLFETAAESLQYGKALRIDGHHDGEPFSFVVAKGQKAVDHLDRRLAGKKGGVA